jgi:hypothetical protein
MSDVACNSNYYCVALVDFLAMSLHTAMNSFVSVQVSAIHVGG